MLSNTCWHRHLFHHAFAHRRCPALRWPLCAHFTRIASTHYSHFARAVCLRLRSSLLPTYRLPIACGSTYYHTAHLYLTAYRLPAGGIAR